MYSIFSMVSSTYAPQFATMPQGIAFVKRLMEAFLTGFGIASGVSYCIFPLTSRTVVFKTAGGYIGALRGALKAQAGYLESLESKDVFVRPTKGENEVSGSGHKRHRSHQKKEDIAQPSPETKTLKAAVAALAELHGKISMDKPFAKREVAYGKLDASDISELLKLMRYIMLPIIGMSSVSDIFDRVAERRGWKTASEDDDSQSEEVREVKNKEIRHWNDVMKTLHQPFKQLAEAMDQGLEHALYTLELAKKPEEKASHKPIKSTPRDVEAKGSVIEPGDRGFADALSANINRFFEQRKLTLTTWCARHGVDMDESSYKGPKSSDSQESIEHHQRKQRQLYMILYVSDKFSFPTIHQALDCSLMACSFIRDRVQQWKRYWLKTLLGPSSKGYHLMMISKIVVALEFLDLNVSMNVVAPLLFPFWVSGGQEKLTGTLLYRLSRCLI